MTARLRDALRSLQSDSRFFSVAVALLALTIGAVTAVYAVVHAIVLRPLPFAEQGRVVMVWQRDDRRALPVIEVAHDEVIDWLQRSRSFSHLAVIGSVNWGFTIDGRTASEQVPYSAVSASFFPVVGTPPALGRALDARDELGTIPQTMVVSHGFWMRRLGGDPAAVGRTVRVNLGPERPAEPIQVVGVMPREFDFPKGAEAWVPAAPLIRMFSASFVGIDAMKVLRVFYGVGRLKPGIRVDAAAADISDVMRTAPTGADGFTAQAVVLTPILSYVLGPAAPILWTLLAGAILMLTIACANAAGLQLSRFAARRHTVAIRLALGASTRQVAAASVLESVIVTAAAALGAVPCAWLIVRGLTRLAPAGVPRLDTITLLHPTVLAVGVAAAFVSVVVSGLLPALRAHRVPAAGALGRSRSHTGDPGTRRVQRLIVVVQVALALTLVAGTALFLRTLRELDRAALGFDPRGLLSLSVSPPTADPAKWNVFFDDAIARVAALPGVSSASAVNIRPLAGPAGWETQPTFPGQTPGAKAMNPFMNLMVVTPGTFETMGIRMVRGRAFTPADRLGAQPVVIVGETAARRLWPGENPIGKRMEGGFNDEKLKLGWQTVVGVAEDVRYRGLNDVRLDLYVPYTQSTTTVQQLMVRASGRPADVFAAVRAAVGQVDPKTMLADDTVMADVVAAESAPWRFLMRVFVSFAVLAATLAAVGLGAVIALAVTTRRRELAIRAALGATQGRLRALVLREGFVLVIGGLALGLAGAIMLGRVVTHLLIGIRPYDPVSLGAAAGVSVLGGLLAMWLPARRAARAHPMEALKTE